jgi:hypothetical protein
MQTFDFARPFQYAFEDPNWMKKVLMGGLFLLIPIVGPMVAYGYMIRTMRQVADGNDSSLPEWDQFGDDLMTGLKAMVTVLGYVFPGFIIYFGAQIVGVILSAVGGHSDAVGTIAGLVMMAGMCLGMPILMIGALLSPIGLLRFVDTGEIGAAFRFGEVLGFVKNNFVNILMALVVGFVGQFIAQFGIIACFIGVLFTMTWALMVQGHAWGQVLKLDRARVNGDSPAPVPAVPAYR